MQVLIEHTLVTRTVVRYGSDNLRSDGIYSSMSFGESIFVSFAIRHAPGNIRIGQ